MTGKRYGGGFWGTSKKNKHPGNAITKSQNLASNLSMLKMRAEEHLREHGIDPENSSMTILQQAQLLDGALGALGSLGGTDLQEFMCGDNFKDKTDQKIGIYTFRGIKNNETKMHELYVWKTGSSDKFMLIHSADSCKDSPEENAAYKLNQRVENILEPMRAYNKHNTERNRRANTIKLASRRNTDSNNALIKKTMATLVAHHKGNSNALRKIIANMPMTTPDELILKQGLQRLHHKMSKKSWAQSLFGTRNN